MKQYELTYLTSVNLTESDLKSLQEKVNALISKNEGALDEIKSPIRKELEYPIKKEGVVYLNTVNFHMPPEKLDEIDKIMETENQIISHMLLIKKPRKFVETRRRVPRVTTVSFVAEEKLSEKPKKVEIKEIEKKLEEILGE